MAQKMLLVPESTVKSSVSTEPLRSRLSRLDTEIEDILQRDLPDDEKLKRYSATLDRYLSYLSQLKQPRTTSQPESEKKTETGSASEESIERILRDLPKTVQKKARGILERIRESDKFGWSDTGRFLQNQREVAGTNIVDLLRDVLVKQRNPSGSGSFQAALEELNVPRSFLLPPPSSASKREYSPPKLYKSPPRRRKKYQQLLEYP